MSKKKLKKRLSKMEQSNRSLIIRCNIAEATLRAEKVRIQTWQKRYWDLMESLPDDNNH